MENLIKKIRSRHHISLAAEKYLGSISKERTSTKGSILIRQGQVVTKNFFVSSGCLRSYCIDKDGKEHTLQFAVKNTWISDYMAIFGNEYATLTVECLVDSNISEFNAQELYGMLELFPEYESIHRGNLERHVVNLQKRILNQMQLSAVERYDLFLTQYGDIEKYTSNYHIASFLGITKESLSRIRVKKAKKIAILT